MKIKLLVLFVALVSIRSKADPIVPNTPLDINFRIHQGAVLLDFDSDVNKYYQFEYSKDNVTWDKEGYSFKGTGGHMSIAVSGRGADEAFYRLRDDGDPKNILLANPSRIWSAQAGNRTTTTVYTNAAPYEIELYVRVGVGSSGDSGASRPTIQTRKDDSSDWLTVGGTRTSSRFLQQEGDINAVIPSGWQYRLSVDVPILQWNELK